MRLWRRGSPLTLLVGMRKCTTTVENSVEGPREVKKIGSLGGAVVWYLSLAQGANLETRDWIPLWAPGHGACFSLCLCLCLSLCDYHKKNLKKVKNRANLWFQICRARYLPWGHKSTLVDSRGTRSPRFLAALSTTAKLWIQPYIHRQMNGQRQCGKYTHCDITGSSEGMKWSHLQWCGRSGK